VTLSKFSLFNIGAPFWGLLLGFLVSKFIEKERPKSKSHFSLKDGLITQKENIPSSTKEKLRIFTDSY